MGFLVVGWLYRFGATVIVVSMGFTETSIPLSQTHHIRKENVMSFYQKQTKHGIDFS